MTSTDIDRTRLAERIHGREMTCRACGARAHSLTQTVIPDRLRGGGAEHLWGTCADCASALRLGALRSAVLREVLDLDPDDPILRDATADRVPMFADTPGRTPLRPNREPWQHLDRDDLARWAEKWKAREAARIGGPCSWCGYDRTPHGTQWRKVGTPGATFLTCGACTYHLGNPSANPSHARDVAAAIVVGLRFRGGLRVPPDLGSLLGLPWWHETGASKPNPAPWAHLDNDALRAEYARLAQSRIIPAAPRWWNPSRVVIW